MAYLKDVAALAGVSLMTASRAINNPELLSKKTYDRVKKAIDQLHYVPDAAALKIRGSSNIPSLIGVLAMDTATTPFSVELLLAIEKTAQKYNWSTLIVNLFDGHKPEKEINTLLSHRPDGIIFSTMGYRQIEIPSRLHSNNLVLANCTTDSLPVASYVPDDYQGQYCAIKRVIEKGYKKPLCISLSENILATKLRKKAIKQAWHDSGLDVNDLFFHHLNNLDISDEYYRDTIDIINHHFKTKTNNFDIIICGNDRIALLVYQALLRLNYDIPNEIAVLGYDNMVGVRDLFYPEITTVELPHYEIGRLAALHIIENKTDTDEHKIDCPLLERKSL